MEWQTVGHSFAKQILGKQIARDLTAHAYVFFGPEGVGKKTLALELARKLGASNHAVLEFSFKESNTEGLRNFLVGLSLKPSEGTRQVAILDSAELMHTASSNTLLKTLEEPTSATTIILISTRRNLPATVLSRSQVVGFGHLTQEELSAVAKRLGLSYTDETIKFACGSAVELVKLATDKDELGRRRLWQQDLQNLISGSVFSRLAVIQDWAKQETEQIGQRLNFWIGQEMFATGTNKLASRLSVLLEAVRRLENNGNKKMVLEYVSLNLG